MPHSPAIVARLAVVDVTAQANVAAMTKATESERAAWSQRATEIVNSRRSFDAKVRGLYRLAEDMGKVFADYAACKRGCSHCCHIAVAVSRGEAQFLSRALGRALPKKVKTRTGLDSFADFDFGYHKPCTFLRNGECSIYADRPMACRVHFNMDVDALLCELHPPETNPVPYLNSYNMQAALLHVCASMLGVDKGLGLADIRTWFPKDGNP